MPRFVAIPNKNVIEEGGRGRRRKNRLSLSDYPLTTLCMYWTTEAFLEVHAQYSISHAHACISCCSVILKETVTRDYSLNTVGGGGGGGGGVRCVVDGKRCSNATSPCLSRRYTLYALAPTILVVSTAASQI